MSSERATPNRAVRKGCYIGCYSILRSEGPTPIVLVFRCRTYSAPSPTSIHIDSPIGLPFQVSHLRRSQSCCFRHLEKPIKTKENKVKHFVLLLSAYIRQWQPERRRGRRPKGKPKANLLIAQGIALGRWKLLLSPCKGKSIASCWGFCPYRALAIPPISPRADALGQQLLPLRGAIR